MQSFTSKDSRLNRSRCAKLVCSIALFLVLGSSLASAQVNEATIVGQIADSAGAFVPDAMVTATNTETGISKTATTDASGNYKLLSLSPGKYDIQIGHPGFATLKITGEDLLVGTTATLNLSIKVSAVTETVEVQAQDAPIMSTTEAVVQRVLQTQEVDSLPVVTRSYSDLSALAPGAVPSGGRSGAGVAIGNSPGNQTGYIIDGITIEAGNQGGPYVQMAQDWIKEFGVVALQFPAQFGNAAAGVINVVTRSGSNALHGRAYEFYQNAIFNSNPAFYTQPTKAPFNSSRTGGTIGGQIVTNKLFYYAGAEYFTTSSTTALSTSVLNEINNPLYTQPIGTPSAQLVPWLVYGDITNGQAQNSETIAIARFDYTPNGKNTFLFRTNLDYSYNNGNVGGSTTYGTATDTFAPHYASVLGWTRTLSDSIVNEARVGYFNLLTNSRSHYCQAVGNYAGGVLNSEPYSYVTTESLGGKTPLGNPVGVYASVQVSGLATTGSSCTGVQNADDSVVFTDSLTIAKGHHEIKVGGIVRKYFLWNHNAHNATDGTYSGASTVFNPNTNFAPAGGVYSTATYKTLSSLVPTSYVEQFPYPVSLESPYFHNYAFGGFAQDSWKARENLSLNVGVRYDFSNENSSLSSVAFPALQAAVPGSRGFIKPGFHDIANDAFNISPRVGFAYTPFKSGKIVVRGGAGVFYNQADTAVAGIYITGNAWAPTAYSIAANVATRNPYCIGNTTCANGIPVAYEFAVAQVLASALANYTVPQFPNAGSACAASNSCTVTVGTHTYTVPALSVSTNPQGNFVDISPNYKIANNVQYTIGGQYQVTQNLNVSADLVKILSYNGPVSVNNNVAPTGLGSSNSYTVVNPFLTTGYQLQSTATLSATDLQMKVHYRDHRGDTINVAYQYGHSHDNSVSNFAISAHNALTTNPFSLQTDYGPSTTDLHHNLNVSGIMPVHFGVQVSPILSIQSGLPYTATSTLQSPGTALAPAGCQAYFTKCYPGGYSRNSLRGDATYTFATRLSKTVSFGGSRSLTVLAEGFNLLNHINKGTSYYSNVDITTGSSAFGLSNGSAGTRRQLQLGGRFDF